MNINILDKNQECKSFKDYLKLLGVKDAETYLKLNTIEADTNYDNIEIAVETLKRYRSREVTILVDS